MRLYLWEAGSALGVTGDARKARRLAARYMWANGVAEAVVAPADFDDGFESMTPGYVRTAQRWTGRRQGGRVVWTCRTVTALTPGPLRAAS